MSAPAVAGRIGPSVTPARRIPRLGLTLTELFDQHLCDGASDALRTPETRRRTLFAVGAVESAESGPAQVLALLDRPGNGSEGRRLPRSWLPETVPYMWQQLDWPEAVLDVGSWVRLWDATGFVDYEGRGLARPAAPVRLYRGAVAEYAEGMAWTDVKSARRYARGEHHAGERSPGAVWTVEVPPANLLARLQYSGPNRVGLPSALRRPTEYQCVIDPRGLQIERAAVT